MTIEIQGRGYATAVMPEMRHRRYCPLEQCGFIHMFCGKFGKLWASRQLQ